METTLKQEKINLVKVVLYGPESSGKTTLSKKLALHYNTVWVPEFARNYLQNKWNTKRKVCEKTDFPVIAKGQIELENKLAKKADRLLICDTDLLATKVYSEIFYNGFVDKNINQAAINNYYNLYLLTYIDTPWEKDDLRDRPNERLKNFNTFKNTLDKYNKPYILLKGSKEQRLKKAIQHINKIIEQKRNLYRYSNTLAKNG